MKKPLILLGLFFLAGNLDVSANTQEEKKDLVKTRQEKARANEEQNWKAREVLNDQFRKQEQQADQRIKARPSLGI